MLSMEKEEIFKNIQTFKKRKNTEKTIKFSKDMDMDRENPHSSNNLAMRNKLSEMDMIMSNNTKDNDKHSDYDEKTLLKELQKSKVKYFINLDGK